MHQQTRLANNKGYPLLGNGCFRGGPCRRLIKDKKGRFGSVEFQVSAGQAMSLEAEELNRGTEALELLSAG
jgi:hypothetical protein